MLLTTRSIYCCRLFSTTTEPGLLSTRPRPKLIMLSKQCHRKSLSHVALITFTTIDDYRTSEAYFTASFNSSCENFAIFLHDSCDYQVLQILVTTSLLGSKVFHVVVLGIFICQMSPAKVQASADSVAMVYIMFLNHIAREGCCKSR